MNNRIIIVAAALGMVLLMGVAVAVISSYGTVTGAAIVQSAISWDIIETGSDVNGTATNDTHYMLETSYQGETKFVKIKVVNSGSANLPVNISITNSKPSDVSVAVLDDNKTQTLANPITIPATDLYVWLEHNFSTSADPGLYSFEVGFLPA